MRASPYGISSVIATSRRFCNTLRDERLHRSVRTVDHQVASVLAKLGADSRAAAIERARREGWLGGSSRIIRWPRCLVVVAAAMVRAMNHREFR